MAIRSPQLQQRIPFVDRDGRLSNEGLRALNDSFKSVVDALNAALGAQDTADGAAVTAAGATLAAVAAQATADAATGDAADAQSSADDAASDAAVAQTTASTALSLATSAVQQDVGPAWAAATGTAARTAYATYAGQTVSNPPTQAEVQAIDDHLVILSQRLKALIDDLKGNGALT